MWSACAPRVCPHVFLMTALRIIHQSDADTPRPPQRQSDERCRECTKKRREIDVKGKVQGAHGRRSLPKLQNSSKDLLAVAVVLGK